MLDGKIFGFGTPESVIDIPRCAAVHVGEVGRVGEEDTVFSPLGRTAGSDRELGFCREPKDRCALREEKRVVDACASIDHCVASRSRTCCLHVP